MDQGELRVGAGEGEFGVFPGLGEVVVFAGQHQGRALRVALEAAEGQQAPAVLPVAFDFRRRQALQLAQQGLAEHRGDAGIGQAQRVDQAGQHAVGEGLVLAQVQARQGFFQQGAGAGAAEGGDAGQQQARAAPGVAGGEEGGQGRAVGQADGHQRRQAQRLGEGGDQVGQVLQAQLRRQLQVAALAGQVEEDHRVLGEQLADFAGEGAEALEGAAEQQHRRARVVRAVGEGLVVELPAVQFEHRRGGGEGLGAVVGAVAHGESPAVFRLLLFFPGVPDGERLAFRGRVAPR